MGITILGIKILIEEANSEENHNFNISNGPQYVVNRHLERQRDFKREKFVSSSRCYTEVSTSTSNSTPSQNKRIAI